MDPIKVVIADSQDLTRFGLKYLISGEKQLLLSGEAKNSKEVINSCREKSPEVLILDYEKDRRVFHRRNRRGEKCFAKDQHIDYLL